VILKFNHTGSLKWNSSWGGADNEYGYDLSLDSKNNSYVAGYSKSYDGSDETACIVKFNSSGDFQWYKLWNNSLADCFYGIECDIANSDNLFATGSTQNLVSSNDLLVVGYTLKPDKFILNSNAAKPDPNGNFTLTWSISLDADNYTVYYDDIYISALDGSQDVIVSGNTNRSLEIKNLTQGTHYYIAQAFNSYGNTTSNCIKIEVLYPPGVFILDETDENPDLDGIINLTWSVSARADNYSVYMHSSYIIKIENNGTLIKSGIKKSNWTIEDLKNGDYFYIIVAYNRAGQNQSNCIQVVVRRKPDEFLLSHNGGNPDTDGNFELIWTFSNFSKNYTIYISTSFINYLSATQEVDVFIPEFEWPSYTYNQIKDSCTYYYVVVAKNKYGNYTSNCVNITINLPLLIPADNDDDDKDDSETINWYIIINLVSVISLGGLLATSYVIWKKKKRFPKKKKKNKKNRIQN
ncbi:MAG: hypothetical protein ACFFDN_12430, partial [Candidatus Hodarchaeota archaeon]